MTSHRFYKRNDITRLKDGSSAVLNIALEKEGEKRKKSYCNTGYSQVTEEVGHAPNCIMVEAINQSGACIFLGVNLEEIVAQGMKRISLSVFSALTSLVS